MVKIKNRYDDVYTFTQTDEGILWEGEFKWLRCGWPNVYTEAYDAYCKDETNPIPLEEFETKVHSYNPETFEAGELKKKYAPLIYSDRTKIDMVDPSGGPYISNGMDMNYISSEFKGMIVDYFVSVKEGYLIKIKQ